MYFSFEHGGKSHSWVSETTLLISDEDSYDCTNTAWKLCIVLGMHIPESTSEVNVRFVLKVVLLENYEQANVDFIKDLSLSFSQREA